MSKEYGCMTMNEGNDIKGKRLNVVLDDDEMKKFEEIRGYIVKKFGRSTATDSAVIKAAILHFADHVERNEVE